MGSFPRALHIDVRQFDKILTFSPAAKTISVQAGVGWRQILERIDPANLSVSVMQSYTNFTVDGSRRTLSARAS
jgi:FAD/FMN-containing dehydrogenase